LVSLLALFASLHAEILAVSGTQVSFVAPSGQSAAVALIVGVVSATLGAVTARRFPRAAQLALVLSALAGLWALVLMMRAVLDNLSGALD
jgi:hypothetical protein